MYVSACDNLFIKRIHDKFIFYIKNNKKIGKLFSCILLLSVDNN